ncbi:MAG TPA: hypothetical protein VM345_03025 [Acidimicrobiales bacterium]|nr:hypothetical protein [Acidimicrobiales bacterium]
MTASIWFSIEVFDGAFGASSWADAHGDALVEQALLSGAADWEWHTTRWGVVFEVAFTDEEAWERFRTTPGVTAALDAVPDPVSGLIIYKGRGGSSGKRDPRKPRPLIGSGAASLPLPDFDDWLSGPDLTLPLERRVLVAG